MTVLATWLATNPWEAAERNPTIAYSARYLSNMTLQDDASPIANFDLTGCTFKLHVWKLDANKTAVISAKSLTAASGTVTIEITPTEAADLPRGKNVGWKVTCESSASPLAFKTIIVVYGIATVVG